MIMRKLFCYWSCLKIHLFFNVLGIREKKPSSIKYIIVARIILIIPHWCYPAAPPVPLPPRRAPQTPRSPRPTSPRPRGPIWPRLPPPGCQSPSSACRGRTWRRRRRRWQNRPKRWWRRGTGRKPGLHPVKNWENGNNYTHNFFS